MTKQRIIFLDFDGVIRTGKSMGKLDPESVRQLNNLLDLTGAEIVVSSSARTTTARMRKLLADWGVIGKVIGITPKLEESNGWDVPRGREIATWLAAHAKVQECEFVILDDDDDMLQLRSRLVQTDRLFGLTEQDVARACALFGAEYRFIG